MKCIKGFVIIAILGLGAGLALVYSGVINVAATNPHSALTDWILSTASDNSIHYQAKGITAPALDDPKLVAEGFEHYREMCVGCHLAPGIKSSEISKGLMPAPPKLQEAAEEWSLPELFWVIKNGIKMTGMPAWGPTHSDHKIWAMAVFVKKLPKMTAAQYKAMDVAAGSDRDHD